MTYWNGTHWIYEPTHTPTAGQRRWGVAGPVTEALLGAILLAIVIASLALFYRPLGLVGEAAAARGFISVPDGVFASTTTATVNPGGDVYVRARCYQNGDHVYEQYVGVDSNNQAVLQLGPTPLWSGGAADCTAEEGSFGRNQRWHTIARTSFSVSD